MKKLMILLICILSLTMISCKDNNNDEKINNETKASNIVIVYFSATSHTEKVAQYISNYYNATIIEIIPKVKYTSSDLNYNSPTSRVSKEHNDRSIRPEISNSIDISSADYVFLGYPIWWGEAPNILYTFVENNDFTGKTIIPFATSASSGIGSSATNLAKNITGNWLEGKRFSSNVSNGTVINWLEELNIKTA